MRTRDSRGIFLIFRLLNFTAFHEKKIATFWISSLLPAGILKHGENGPRAGEVRKDPQTKEFLRLIIGTYTTPLGPRATTLDDALAWL